MRPHNRRGLQFEQLEARRLFAVDVQAEPIAAEVIAATAEPIAENHEAEITLSDGAQLVLHPTRDEAALSRAYGEFSSRLLLRGYDSVVRLRGPNVSLEDAETDPAEFAYASERQEYIGQERVALPNNAGYYDALYFGNPNAALSQLLTHLRSMRNFIDLPGFPSLSPTEPTIGDDGPVEGQTIQMWSTTLEILGNGRVKFSDLYGNSQIFSDFQAVRDPKPTNHDPQYEDESGVLWVPEGKILIGSHRELIATPPLRNPFVEIRHWVFFGTPETSRHQNKVDPFDVNADGEVDDMDLRTAMDVYSRSPNELLHPDHRPVTEFADVNGDNRITAVDVFQTAHEIRDRALQLFPEGGDDRSQSLLSVFRSAEILRTTPLFAGFSTPLEEDSVDELFGRY